MKWRVVVEEREERFFYSYDEAAAAFRDAVLGGAKLVRLERIPSRWERLHWLVMRVAYSPLTLLCYLRLCYYMWKRRGAEEVPLLLHC